MIDLGSARRDLEAVEEVLGDLAPVGGRGLVPLLAAQEAMAYLAREQEDAAMEAEDILSQADEALVMG